MTVEAVTASTEDNRHKRLFFLVQALVRAVIGKAQVPQHSNSETVHRGQ